MQQKYILRRTEILILLANIDEFDGFIKCLDHYKVTNRVVVQINNFEIYAFKYNSYHICYFLVDGTGPRSAINALRTVADNFPNLNCVVNIGCCASTKLKVSKEVIFADRVFDADAKKIKNKVNQFAIAENKHQTFSNIIKSRIKDYKSNYLINYAPLISSSGLIKDKDTKKLYVKAYPYAAGIEMEGVAVSDYALLRGLEWIVIKGTSDNGVNKKGNAGQTEAAYNASDLFFHILDVEALSRTRAKVFIGGAISKNANTKISREVESNCYNLASCLLKNNYKIINGLGQIVGTSLVSAVYSHKRDTDCDSFDSYMEIFPFPRVVDKKRKATVQQFYEMNRRNMIKQCVFSLFVYGRNTKDGEQNGLEDEFNIAGSFLEPRIVIPQAKYLSKKLFTTVLDTKFEGIKSKEYCDLYMTLIYKESFDIKIKKVIQLLDILDNHYFGLNKF